jgi:mRNA interferase HigB
MVGPEGAPRKNRVISWRKIREFVEAHPEDPSALDSFSKWYDLVRNVPFASFHEVKRAFPTASLVGELVVFNVGGNKYRLAARVIYGRGRVYVRRVMTHGEYDKGGWQE